MKRLPCILILLIAAACLANPPFAPNVKVSDDAGGQVINQGESDFTVWHGQAIYSCCNLAERSTIAMIPYAWSTNGGTSFMPNLPFNDPTPGNPWHSDPVIGVDDSGHVHMLVQYSTVSIYHYFSTNGGLSWQDTTRVTPSSGCDKPWMVIYRNEIYIVWQQVSGSTGLWQAKSTDYGRSFTTGRIWTRTGVSALDMDENQNLHLGLVDNWPSGNVYYRKSTDRGVTWSTEVLLSNSSYSTGYGDRAPINSIAAHGQNVFLTWVDSRTGTWDVVGCRSTNGGATWSSRFTVNQDTAGGQCKGWAEFDPFGGLHVMYYTTPNWPTNSSSRWSIRYRYSPNGGATFNPSLRISDTTFASPVDFMGEYHIILADSQYVYAQWTDGRAVTNNDLYFSKAPLSSVGVAQGNDRLRNPVMAKGLLAPTVWAGPVVLKLSPREQPVSLAIYDVAGRRVRGLYEGKVVGETEVRLRSSEFHNGLYFLLWRSGEEQEVKKVVNFPR
jgi:hypothetical protein